ncbi:hypothetical protein Fcan01_17135 [Folsomia candida]|uniref:Uncharacterized protein n=1 Tax=Folsomia candida TaxID=158441 RepID=A0A226DS85_FOLCA|nr:hypothetical protein Fcan01_17135 [Folsomia candida]
MKFIEAIVFFVGVVICHAHHPHDSQAIRWSDLKECIVASGSDPSDIVEYLYDDYQKYTELNYQWNLIHERKYPRGYFTVRSAADVQSAVRCATERLWVEKTGVKRARMGSTSSPPSPPLETNRNYHHTLATNIVTN